MNKPGILIGGLVGLLLTIPLVVVSALANQLAGLPFAPFDLFPFIRDLLPGALLTFGIDTMVDVLIRLNLGRVDEAAKVAEQGMAIGMLLAVGLVAGLIFFAVMNRLRADGLLGGLLLGLIVGIPMALISANLGLSATNDAPALNAIWLIALFIVWGLLVGWSYERLTGSGLVAPTAPPARAAQG